MRELLAALIGAHEQGKECVYCSVVETRGSTPRKPGAAMLVFPDGSQFGTLGGGCIEAEVRQRALLSLNHGRSEVHVFCLDDNYGWDDGLICGGRMTILADPVFPGTAEEDSRRQFASDYYRRYRELVERGQGCTEAVVMAAGSQAEHAGQRFLFGPTGLLEAGLGTASSEEVARHLIPIRNRPLPYSHHGIAYLPVLPRITLLIVGGGHVGQAVARLAVEVDFDVWVLDDREAFASRERFPAAQRLLVADIGGTLAELVRGEIHLSTYCIIVTRGHSHDEEALYRLAPSEAGYLGMIGSKRKKKLIYEDLIARGIPEKMLERVRSPLGIEIGSRTVPEIAISIVAELIAFRNLGECCEVKK